MKKFAFLTIGTLLLVGVLLASTNGCGARAKVAGDNLVSMVDDMLGEMKVKRQQISDKMDALEQGIKDIREAKIKTDVQKEMLENKANDQKELAKKGEDNLKRVRTLLEKANSENSKTVKTESGKELETGTLKEVATKLIEQQKEINTKLKGYEDASATLQRVVDSLDKKESEYKKTIEKLKQTLVQIDAKQTAAETMKKASASVDGQANLKDSIADLEKEIEELNVSVETSLRLEDDKWSESEEANKLKDAMAEIESSGSGDDLLNQIDSLLDK